jgi:hypothetical protein
MEDVGVFYGHLVYFKAIWYILWLFGNIFPRSLTLYQENYGSPDTVQGCQIFLGT